MDATVFSKYDFGSIPFMPGVGAKYMKPIRTGELDYEIMVKINRNDRAD